MLMFLFRLFHSSLDFVIRKQPLKSSLKLCKTILALQVRTLVPGVMCSRGFLLVELESSMFHFGFLFPKAVSTEASSTCLDCAILE